MKFWKIPLVLIALLIMDAPSAFAYVDCDDVNESSTDTVRVIRTKGKPGDTVMVSFYAKIDSLTAGFKYLLRYDSTKIRPVVLPPDTTIDTRVNPPDTNIRFYLPAVRLGALKTLQDEFNVDNPPSPDTTYLFLPQLSQNPFDSGAILAGWIPDFTARLYYMQSAREVIFRLPFIINTAMAHNDSTRITFHEVNEFYIVSGLPVFTDCRRTDFASAWRDAAGTVVSTTTLFPRTIDGYFVADTLPLPVVNTFSATPSTITSGNASVLSWDVTNMDSLRITGGSTNVGSTSLTGFTTVTPTVTTTYTLTAWKGVGNITAQAAVTVTGSTPGNTAPVITLNPPGNSYNIDQLETVSFTVTTTDVNGDPVTLSASQLPANATFATATGTGSASQTFTFTPSLAQQGQFTVIFNASDNRGGSSSAAVAITVTELQDQLFTTSKIGGKPVGGIRGTQQILFPIDLVSKQKVYGVQFDMYYNHNFFTVDSFITTPRTNGFVIYDLVTAPGVSRVAILDLANDSIKTLGGDSTAILYAVISIDSSALPGNYPVYLRDGWESVNPDPEFPAFQLVTDSGIIQVDRPGDVNLDGNVNIADPVSMIGYIIGSFPLKPRNFAVADVITNDTVDVFDLVGVINLVLGGTLSPVAGQPFGDEPATIALAYSDITAGLSDIISVESEMPTSVAGVQMEISYDASTMIIGVPKLANDARMLNMVYRDDGRGRLHVLMYFRGGYTSELKSGASTLLEVPMTAIRDIKQAERKPINLRMAKVSTKESQVVMVSGVTPNVPSSFSLNQNYPNPFNPTTNIEFNIDVSDNDLERGMVTLDVFNLLGQRVARLFDGERMPGRYRVAWDGTNGAGGRVSSGVYFYRLQVGSESQTKKMVLVK
jgi:hypothetical protein